MEEMRTGTLEKPQVMLAGRLKTLRMEFGLTQAELAAKLGLSQQTYSNFEKGNGRLDVGVLKKVCDLYGVSSDYILGLDENRERATVVQGKTELKMVRVLSEKK